MPESDEGANQLYGRSMQALVSNGVPFLLGGAYAFCVYTGIARETKDFDLFVRQSDFDRALNVLHEAGYRAEKTFPHWLGKAFIGDHSIDIIYRAGNGLCPVDNSWFARARQTEVFGLRPFLCPPEEMIWMKAYIMERERFDGADVAHLLLHCGDGIDWDHLLERFGPDWRVLLSHLVLYGFIYPSEKNRVPNSILDRLTDRLREENPATERVCRGTLLSRAQFLTDVSEGGWRDARLEQRAGLTPAEIAAWTEAIHPELKPHRAVAGN